MDSVLAKKLQYKYGMKALVLNSPPGYLDKLISASDCLPGATDKSLEFAQVFVKNVKELESAIPSIKEALKKDGILWVSFPEGTSKIKTDLNHDILRKEMERFHLVGVSLVSLDETWSTMRFRPIDKVGT